MRGCTPNKSSHFIFIYIYMEINMYFYCIPTPGLLLKLFLILDFMCQDLWDLLDHLVSSLLNLSVYVPEVRHWFILLPSAFCSVLKYFLSRSIPWDIVNLNQGWSSLFLRALLLSRILKVYMWVGGVMYRAIYALNLFIIKGRDRE